MDLLGIRQEVIKRLKSKGVSEESVEKFITDMSITTKVVGLTLDELGRKALLPNQTEELLKDPLICEAITEFWKNLYYPQLTEIISPEANRERYCDPFELPS